MFAVMDDIDELFNDVGEVQKELETFGAERIVDSNEIYELLETHYLRSDRVQFVTSHHLVSLGLRINCDDVPDESDDDYLEDLHCTSSMEYIALNIPDVLDLSSSDFVMKFINIKLGITIFYTGAYISGIKVFNHLPQHIKALTNDHKYFKSTLKRFLYHHSFYSMNEYYEYKEDRAKFPSQLCCRITHALCYWRNE